MTDRIYAITGAGGALCGVMARELGARGARIALLDVDEDAGNERADEIREAGGRAIALRCDVLDAGSIGEAADAIEQEWGVPDVLINGAGGNHPSGSTTESFASPEAVAATERPEAGDTTSASTFFDLPVEGFERVFDLNFLGTVLPSRIIGRRMATRGSGSIVNMSSMSALTPLTKVGAYSAAKTAVASLTRWLAVHLAPVGIRVNALAPGFFMTEQLRFLHVDQETGELTPRAKAVIAHTPMGRYGEPEELVGAIIWLSGEGSSFVTGIVLPIDGGFSSYSI
ncbi:MAG: SDR family oxidoreductase [Spirochaetota bacterium]